MRTKVGLSVCIFVLSLSGPLFGPVPGQAQEGKLEKALEAVGRAEEELAPEEADFGLGRALDVLEDLNEGERPEPAEPTVGPFGPEGTPGRSGIGSGFGRPVGPSGGFGIGRGIGGGLGAGRGRGR